MRRNSWIGPAVLVSGLVLSSCTSTPSSIPSSSTPVSGSTSVATPDTTVNPVSLISHENLYAFLEELASIQPYSGWRNSGTEGETEALSYIANTLGNLTHLQNLGMELERQTFRVFLATEMWETRLFVTMQGQEIEVPADAPRGHRHNVLQALRFDSDGVLNDSDRNPAEATGEIMLIRSAREIDDLEETGAEGKIVLLDSAVVGIDVADRHAGSEEAAQIISRLIEQRISGLVLVTECPSLPAMSLGKFVGDGVPLEGVMTEAVIPTLYVRLDDLAAAGIFNWEDLAQIESLRLVWDTDVFAPGTSGNLVAHIPGADSSQAIIVGAHIDSANSPGALDNGISSVVLLEVARILNEAQAQPPLDLYLVWFGSEEIGVYGSQHFVNTHQELFDRTVAALSMDGIIVSTPSPLLVLSGWSHSRFGNSELPFARYLEQVAALRDITIQDVQDYQGITSDNGVFSGFVTQAGLAFGSEQGDRAHSPYDSADAAQGLEDLLEQITTVALIAALETGQAGLELNATPEPDRHALLIASHTEAVHMAPSALVDLDRALAWEGFDVDAIPYGQAVTAGDLADSELVVVLPVIDYPSSGSAPHSYDESWSDDEIESLVAYVEQGGLLVLTNSANRILLGMVYDPNEDWQDVNSLSSRFGVVFVEEGLTSMSVQIQGEHALLEGLQGLTLLEDNTVPFTMETGETLAEVDGMPVVGVIDYGEAGGQVLVLGDIGTLGVTGLGPSESDSLNFVLNLAQYAAGR